MLRDFFVVVLGFVNFLSSFALVELRFFSSDCSRHVYEGFLVYFSSVLQSR